MAKEKHLPKREEISDQHKWRLEDIYASQDAWEKEFQAAKSQIPQAASFSGRLDKGAEVLYQALELSTQLDRKVTSLYSYAKMRLDENTANAQYQALVDRMQGLATELGSALAYMLPEILAIPEEKLAGFMAACQPLGLYRFYLADINRLRPHTLSTAEEQIVAQVGELAAGPHSIFSMLNNADMKFPNIRDEDGQEVQLTHGRYVHYMESPDRRVRQDAFTAIYDTYGKLKNTITATFSTNVKRDLFYSRVHQYPSSLAAALAANNVPMSVYDNLISAVRANLPIMHRYVSLRKQAMGLDQIHMYDIYTPMVKDVKMTIPYEDACRQVIDGLAVLGPEYQSVLSQGLDSHWVDVYENEGKSSGAYSWGTYDSHPFVLLNYQDNLDNMFTLAHEMGHSLHTYYSQQTQPYLYANYSIFVAEVASTVNEALLMEHLLKKHHDDAKIQGYLVNHYLEQFRGTVFRQTMFAEFEKKAHQLAEGGEALTVDRLCQLYYDLNKDYFGPEMVVDDQIALEWMRIPHFYTSFYVYQYATGYSAAIALSQAMLKEGPSAVSRYLDFLKSGGSDHPINILKRAGVNMSTPEPVDSALRVFGQLVDKMGQLTGVKLPVAK